MNQTSSLFRQLLVPALALFTLTQCTEQSEIKTAPEAAIAVTTAAEDEPAISVTIDGVHTVLASTTDCKTCDYVVPAEASIIDGNEIKIKPGQTICMDAAIKYGNLKFINLVGEESKPITVAYGVKNLASLSASGE